MQLIAAAVTIVTALSFAIATDTSTYSNPFPPFQDINKETIHDAKREFISRTIGSNMVLQRDRPATIWGFSTPGATVTTTFEGLVLNSIVGPDGTWRQKLPSRPASLQPTSIHVSASTGESDDLTNILFGDVYICGGQSNMQFAIPGVPSATEEAAVADGYPHIRLFTVGTDTSSAVPLDDLQTVWQTWKVANSQTVAQSNPTQHSFYLFSAVCWYFGKTVADGLDNEVPIGLVSNNWGGTSIQLWSTRDALDECGNDQPQGKLYNAMIHPYTVGPMAISGFTWYQGESNTKDQQSADLYACLFPSMIRAWRKAMEVPDAYFGFVQLSTWCPPNPVGVAQMRDAQMSALLTPGKVGYATNADHGAGCDIHPPLKKICGNRLGISALSLNYGKEQAWRSPSYSGVDAKIVSTSNSPFAQATVTVQLAHVSSKGLYFRDPYNLNTVNCTAQLHGTCAWASIELSTEGWVNATAVVSNGMMTLIASTENPTQSILASSYGWGSVPMLTVYDAGTDLPVLPWNRSIAPLADRSESLRKRVSWEYEFEKESE